jgi:8-oxo-dGTP diphosphatase
MMPLYICRRWEGIVSSRENQALKWVRPRDLRNYPMPPADEPLIPALIDIVG